MALVENKIIDFLTKTFTNLDMLNVVKLGYGGLVFNLIQFPINSAAAASNRAIACKVLKSDSKNESSVQFHQRSMSAFFVRTLFWQLTFT